MFTGIIRSKGWILSIESKGDGQELAVRCPEIQQEIEVGDSVAVNGVCLTVEQVQPEEPILTFHVIRETLDRTNLSFLDVGDQVNIEPSLRLGDSLSGHFVMGHVENTGIVDRVEEHDEERTMWIEAPEEVLHWMVSKGCVAVDGVSLTPVEIQEDRFSVELIPETLEKTTLGIRSQKERVNLEVDLIAKYVGEQVDRITKTE